MKNKEKLLNLLTSQSLGLQINNDLICCFHCDIHIPLKSSISNLKKHFQSKSHATNSGWKIKLDSFSQQLSIINVNTGGHQPVISGFLSKNAVPTILPIGPSLVLQDASQPQSDATLQDASYPQSSTSQQDASHPQSDATLQDAFYPQSDASLHDACYPQSDACQQDVSYPQSDASQHDASYPQSDASLQDASHPQSSACQQDAFPVLHDDDLYQSESEIKLGEYSDSESCEVSIDEVLRYFYSEKLHFNLPKDFSGDDIKQAYEDLPILKSFTENKLLRGQSANAKHSNDVKNFTISSALAYSQASALNWSKALGRPAKTTIKEGCANRTKLPPNINTDVVCCLLEEFKI